MRIELSAPESFRQVLSERLGRSDPPAVTGITIDSRQVKPGDVFVAIRGQNFDGHDFAEEAVKAGAKFRSFRICAL